MSNVTMRYITKLFRPPDLKEDIGKEIVLHVSKDLERKARSMAKERKNIKVWVEVEWPKLSWEIFPKTQYPSPLKKRGIGA